MKKILTTLALSALVTPCVSAADTNAASNASYLEGRNVYIRLIKQDDGWRFSDRLSLSPSKSDAHGMDVLLNDLSPFATAASDVKVQIMCHAWHCSVDGNNFENRKQALNSTVTPWAGPFYRSDLNVAGTMFTNTVGVLLTLGVTAGANESEYSFDRSAFTKALNEAVAADSMNDERRRMIIASVGELRAQSDQPAASFDGKLASAKRVYSKLAIDAAYQGRNAPSFQMAGGFTNTKVSNGPAPVKTALSSRADMF